MPRGPTSSPRSEAVVSALLPWFRTQARDLPWRRTRDPYAVWISEIMLQQTQVRTVIPYWERWMRALPDLKALATTPEERVLKLWEGLGYYSRARNAQRAAEILLERHHGQFPASVPELLELPGIGRYTAGAIASIAFNQPAPILDGNVIRVLTRLHALGGDPKAKRLNNRLWRLAEDLVSSASRTHRKDLAIPHSTGPCSALNQSLMELGATICTPRDPACPACPLADLCRARRKGRVNAYPRSSTRPPSVSRRILVAVVERSGRFLLRQRPPQGVNGGLWEFPERNLADGEPAIASALAWLKPGPTELKPLGSIRHTITRYRIHLEVFHLKASPSHQVIEPGAHWVSRKKLIALPLTAAHRRIAGQLLDRAAAEGRAPQVPHQVRAQGDE